MYTHKPPNLSTTVYWFIIHLEMINGPLPSPTPIVTSGPLEQIYFSPLEKRPFLIWTALYPFPRLEAWPLKSLPFESAYKLGEGGKERDVFGGRVLFVKITHSATNS